MDHEEDAAYQVFVAAAGWFDISFQRIQSWILSSSIFGDFVNYDMLKIQRYIMINSKMQIKVQHCNVNKSSLKNMHQDIKQTCMFVLVT